MAEMKMKKGVFIVSMVLLGIAANLCFLSRSGYLDRAGTSLLSSKEPIEEALSGILSAVSMVSEQPRMFTGMTDMVLKPVSSDFLGSVTAKQKSDAQKIRTLTKTMAGAPGIAAACLSGLASYLALIWWIAPTLFVRSKNRNAKAIVAKENLISGLVSLCVGILLLYLTGMAVYGSDFVARSGLQLATALAIAFACCAGMQFIGGSMGWGADLSVWTVRSEKDPKRSLGKILLKGLAICAVLTIVAYGHSLIIDQLMAWAKGITDPPVPVSIRQFAKYSGALTATSGTFFGIMAVIILTLGTPGAGRSAGAAGIP